MPHTTFVLYLSLVISTGLKAGLGEDGEEEEEPERSEEEEEQEKEEDEEAKKKKEKEKRFQVGEGQEGMEGGREARVRMRWGGSSCWEGWSGWEEHGLRGGKR